MQACACFHTITQATQERPGCRKSAPGIRHLTTWLTRSAAQTVSVAPPPTRCASARGPHQGLCAHVWCARPGAHPGCGCPSLQSGLRWPPSASGPSEGRSAAALPWLHMQQPPPAGTAQNSVNHSVPEANILPLPDDLMSGAGGAVPDASCRAQLPGWRRRTLQACRVPPWQCMQRDACISRPPGQADGTEGGEASSAAPGCQAGRGTWWPGHGQPAPSRPAGPGAAPGWRGGWLVGSRPGLPPAPRQAFARMVVQTHEIATAAAAISGEPWLLQGLNVARLCSCQ